MRIFALLFAFFSLSSLACIPCDDDSTLLVKTQATPKFPKSYQSTEIFGHVTFKMDVIIREGEKIKKIQILELFPSDLPEDVILEMIDKSDYRFFSDKEGYSACTVKYFELTFEFAVPQKLDFEIDVGL